MVVRLQRNRGKVRLWIEGRVLSDAGLSVGDTFTFTLSRGRVEIRKATTAPAGMRLRRVYGRRGRPIIDINTDDLLAIGAAALSPETAAAGVLILVKAKV